MLFYLIFLLTIIKSLPVGDVTIPLNASSFEDYRIKIYICVDSNNFTVVATLKRYGYFSIEYKNSMTDGDYSIIQIRNGTVSLMDAYSPEHDTPYADKKNDLHLLGSDTDNKTYVTIKYTRKLNTGDSQDIALNYGQAFIFCYAVRAGSTRLEKHEGGQFILFAGHLVNGTIFTRASLNSQTHGIILTIAWCFLADLGVFFKYMRSFQYNIIVHGIIYLLVLILSIIEIILQIQENSPTLQSLDYIQSVHFVIGILILSWMLFQFIIGIVTRVLQKNSQYSPNTINIIRKIHKFSGYILILLCKAEVLIGWKLQNSDIAFTIMIIWISFLLLLISVYIFYEERDISIDHVKITKQDLVKYRINLNIILRPYCHDSNENFLIFNDQVYIFQESNFHPGGAKIIQATNRRQIDRFIYGMYGLETSPQIKPFIHPINSFKILGSPLYNLPKNEMYQLNSQKYILSNKTIITDNVNLFYFKGKEGDIKYTKTKDLRHIGQYFTINGFNTTRLYTCVAFLRRANLQKNYQYLKQLKIFILQQKLYIHDKYLKQQNIISNDKFSSSTINEQLPLLIKKYDKGKFTKPLFLNSQNYQFKIDGLKGRGLGLQYLQKGNIVLIAGGTGLFPFLDLIDIIFKILVKPLVTHFEQNQIQIFFKILKKFKFTLFGSFQKVEDMIIPSQLYFMNQIGADFFKMFVRIKQSHQLVGKSCFINERIDSNFIKKYISPLKQKLSMVYICGPPILYQQVTSALELNLIPSKKIFYV